MKKVTLKLNNLTCPACLSKIQKALSQQAGVEKVAVLFNAGKAKVEFDETTTSAEQLSAVVTKLGYPVEKMTVKEM